MSLSNIILASALYLKNTSFIQTCIISSTKISFIYRIKYLYLVNLSTITKMLLYSCPIIQSFNFSSLTIKSYNITFYSYITNLTSYNFLCSLYLFSLFLQQFKHSLITFLAIFQIPYTMYSSYSLLTRAVTLLYPYIIPLQKSLINSSIISYRIYITSQFLYF